MKVMREDVAAWLETLALPTGDPVLDDMHREAAERRFPIVGPQVGRVLYQLAVLTGARRIFEMGSGFGYSTLWFARGMAPGGRIYHTDGDLKNTDAAREYLNRAGLLDRVVFSTGDAREILAHTPGEFDVVFMDIDKHQYPDAYRKARGRVRVGGLFVVDNLVWGGRVATGDADPDSAGIREYIDLMWNDAAFVSSLLPIRDGVGVSLRVA